MSVSKKLTTYILAMLGTSCYILADTFFISASEGTSGITALLFSMVNIPPKWPLTPCTASGCTSSDFCLPDSILWVPAI